MTLVLPKVFSTFWNATDAILVPALHHRSQIPRHELVLSIPMQLALGLLSRSCVEHHPEKALADLLDGRGAVDDLAAVDVDVLFLTLPQRAVGRELERR